MRDGRADRDDRTGGRLGADGVFSLALLAFGSAWFFATPVDSTDLSNAAFGLAVAAGAACWLLVTAARAARRR